MCKVSAWVHIRAKEDWRELAGKQMKDYIVENQGLIGQREFLQLSMQITSNVVEMQDLRRDLMNVKSFQNSYFL